MADFLEFQGISKKFGDRQVLDNISLSLQKGEFYSLLGPSGCGKTTIIRICAGFEQPDSGRVILNGKDITHLPPNQRQVNTVFQSYALFPHLTVRDNIAFGLRIARKPKDKIKQEVDRYLDMIQMTDHADKKPSQLSGGQKQRVAIARALINKPQVLLLDEPLAALDLKLRQRMLIELDELHDEVGITFIFVTHDQGEAMSLSDRIAVVNEGKIEQIGNPMEIYEAPRSSFVAAFIGDTNFFDGVVTEIEGVEYSRLQIEGFPSVMVYNDQPKKIGDLVHLSVRPEKISIFHEKPSGNGHRNMMRGKVEDAIYLGGSTKFWVRVQDYRIAVSQQHKKFHLDEKPIIWGNDVWVSWQADDGYMLYRYEEKDESLLSLPDD